MKTSFANSAIHSLWFLTVVSLFALGGLVSSVSADPVSISINFGPHFGAPTGGDLGVVPVNYQYWNNAISTAGIGLNQYTASGNPNQYNKTGTINNQIDNPEFFTSNLISHTGADTGTTATWNCKNTYRYSESRPSTDNNAILFYGYLDDSDGIQKFNMTAPFFSYDIYYYATTDGVAFRYATINSCNYAGNTTRGTVVGTANWGTPVRGNISTMTEGVNYLRVSFSDPSIAISGVAYANVTGGRARGSFGALQIVNTANSQSLTTAENSLILANATWNNDLTGAAGESFNASADGYRIIYTGMEETFTVDLNGAATLPNVKLIGSANLAFTNGTLTQLGQTNTVQDLGSTGTGVSLPNLAPVAKQGAVKFGPNTTFAETPTAEGIITGAYYVDGTTVSFAKIAKFVNEDESVNYVLAPVVPTSGTPADGMDLLVNDVITDNATRTLNSLTSTHDYKNNSALTITSGMMLLNNRNHWVQGGGTITSGYRNADGEYDLYLCALGTADDMRIDSSTIIDNPAGKLNLIKTGSGAASISRAKSANTYSGKTIVLEGHLQIAENVRSTEFYVARGAVLDFSSQNYRGGDLGDYNFTATVSPVTARSRSATATVKSP